MLLAPNLHIRRPINEVAMVILNNLDLANRSFGSNTGWAKFGLGYVSGEVIFLVSSVWVRCRFRSTSYQLMFSSISLSCKNKQLCRKFRVGYGLVRVSSSFG